MLTTVLRRLRILKGDANHYVSDLAELAKDYNRLKMTKKTGLKVLYGPSFCIYPPCYVHDSLFSHALRLRGAEIIPVYCDAIQTTECNVYGGVWGGGDKFTRNCGGCREISARLWNDIGLNPLRFSKYIGEDDLQIIQQEVDSLSNDEWLSYEADGMPFGHWAKDILVNNWVVGDYRRIKDHERLGRAHLKNLKILSRVYQRMLDDTCPDRVVANDSYYGMWAVLRVLCQRKGIPFYSQWQGGRQNTWCYALNDAAMNLDFSKPWKRFSQIPLSDRRRNKVQNWLDGRSVGKEMIMDTASLGAQHTERFDLARVNKQKPTALLAANVIWDLSALNKQIVFSDMMDWIAQTIHWFSLHPEYQLVIKPHPVELYPSVPATEERVETAIARRQLDLPANVFLLSPRTSLTVYDLFPLATVGLVHTTTVGVEMAASGLPVITTAKSPYRGFGLTLDPSSPEEYFCLLERTLRGERFVDQGVQVDLSYKFILFYHYHYYTKIDVMDYTWGKEPLLKVKSASDLLPGKNQFLDYVADSIIGGLPIVSEDRWPAES